jgi:hypothetical protein
VKGFDVGPVSQHTDGNVDYAQTPLAGGKLSSVWQNADFYSDHVPEENAVCTPRLKIAILP